MNFLEKNLEDIICETSDKHLTERGLEMIAGKRYRQLRIGNYGVADLVTLYRGERMIEGGSYHQFIDITIYELKKDDINCNTLMQAYRYLHGIRNYLEKRGKFAFIDVNYYIVLVGKKVDLYSDFTYLFDNLFNVTVYEYGYSFDGITFKEKGGYKLTNEGF